MERIGTSSVLDPIDPAALETVVYWIREREAIRRAKEAGMPKPWTRDPLLRDFRWCCVRRLDDKVSRELMTGWYADGQPAEQLVAAALGRLINWPEALFEATGNAPFRLGALPGMRIALHARAARPAKIFTGAYVCPGVTGKNKVDSTLDLVELISARADQIIRPTLKETWARLVELDGLGSFLAGQIVADLAHLSTGAKWADRISWAPVGPGSARGMNRLRGRPKTKPLPQDQFDEELAEFSETLRPLVADIAIDRQLGAADFQSVCCETDKYFRLRGAEGKVRAKYDGAGELQGSLL